jgi:hypothetical protein
MFSAEQIRGKDTLDAELALPRLNASARRWLRDAVARMDPDHPWVKAL